MSQFVKDKEIRNSNVVGCSSSYSKGDSGVGADYLLSRSGYVLSGLTYGFETAEPASSIYARLTKKWGPGEKFGDWDDNQTWWSNPSDTLQPFGRLSHGGPNHPHKTIEISGSNVMTDTFVGEFQKDLVRRLGSVTTPL